MRVAFIHYHLNPGGVTTVIRQQVAAIRNMGGETVVFTGLSAPPHFPAETIQIPGLGYHRDEISAPSAERIAAHIASEVIKRWPEGCDLLHVHNPILAKNIRFPAILDELQQKDFRLLLQIHDFAEDGRPDAYFRNPYPRDCHYIAINSRDYSILLEAGLKKEGLHLLPNMVSPLETPPAKPPKTPFCLYPVRAIRRKNIGEAVLLSLFFRPGLQLAVTLPPRSPDGIGAYQDWRRFVETHQLPVGFDAGLTGDFPKLAAGAEFFVTTSITEGFGFSFLEPWTAGKSLLGRKLADICIDFETRGIALDDLYTRLRVPTDWFDHKAYLHAWRSAVEKACNRYACSIPSSTVREAEARMTRSTETDFGLLNEKLQKEVLRLLLKDPGKMNVLKRLNPFLEQMAGPWLSRERIQQNREIVLSDYGAAKYADTLQTIYSRVSDVTVSHGILKEVLLSRFLNLERLSLLKWGEYVR